MEPRITSVYPGGNTGYGFYSFYDHIIGTDATRIYVVKGGPGVGKSTFMSRIADKIIERGYSAEYLCCSSDNDSYDGVRFPELKIAFLDGTAPHVVDPKNPGAVDTIIHLGDHWNQQGIMKHKQQVLDINREVGRLFGRAYDYLAIAKRSLEALESYTVDALDTRGLNKLGEMLIRDAIGSASKDTPGKVRSMFASAISPNGFSNFLDNLMESATVRYVVQGLPGSGRTSLIARLADEAVRKGFFVECFHCSLDPKKIEHMIIPDLGVAVTLSAWPHEVRSLAGDIIIDTTPYVDERALARHDTERANADDLYHHSLELGQRLIADAKRTHDAMEEYYTPYMDFDAIARVRERTLADVLALAGID